MATLSSSARVWLAVLLLAVLAGCTSAAPGSHAPSPPLPPSQAAPSPAAASASVALVYEESDQFELLAPSGRHVIVDLTSAGDLTHPGTGQDVLLITEGHHIDFDTVDSFPGQKLVIQTGTVAAGDIAVTGIAASHNEEPIDPSQPTDVIYVVEIAGLRFVFFGEIGQTELTQEQLKAIGRVDVLLAPLANPPAFMDAANRKGINLAAQVKPALVIPTLADVDTAKLAAQTWQASYSTSTTVMFSASNLPAKPSIVFMGAQAPSYAAILKLSKAGW